LGIAWYLDANFPALIRGFGSLFVTGFIAAVIEMVIVGETTKYFRKLDAAGG
jgi:hypothetical protein